MTFRTFLVAALGAATVASLAASGNSRIGLQSFWVEAIEADAPLATEAPDTEALNDTDEIAEVSSPLPTELVGETRVARVTAYCDRGTTAAGVPSGLGQCAAPADVPFGSLIYIPSLDRTFVVTDRTHRRFRHNTVDLFMRTADECRQFGRSYLEVVIIPPQQPHRYGCKDLLAMARAVR